MKKPAADIPDLGPAAERPQPSRGASLTAHKLTPTEGFILSRVDGVTSWGDLCAMSGLGAEPTAVILRRLLSLGLITRPVQAQSRPAPAPPPRITSPGIVVSLLALHDDDSPVDAALLAQGPGLPEDLKARIVRLHRKLASLAPHDLLGVPEGSDAATVKKTYFAASKELHPDRYYGKDMGPYRDWLGEIFAACAHAFETLAGERTKKKSP